MWQHLRLSSLGVIDSAELELSAGFTVITGETGAGKTMVVTALGLLRGDRADLGLIRQGASQARVEASIETSRSTTVATVVEEAGGRIDDGVVVLSRILSAQGRSRAIAGGATVPAALLADVTDELVAVHGQSDQHRLLRAAEQRTALDRFAGDAFASVKATYEPTYRQWRTVERTLHEVRNNSRERARELDVLRFGLAEVAEVGPLPSEDELLKAEEGRLAHSESLALAADVAQRALAQDDETSARTRVAEASAALRESGGHDSALDALAVRVFEVGILLDDVSAELGAYAEGVELDPHRLASVQERRAALSGLLRKYGPTLDDVLVWAEKSESRLRELDNDDAAIEALEAEEAELRPEVLRLAHEMSGLRAEAAVRLSDLVGHELAELSMPSARLTVEVATHQDATPGQHGMDEVEFMFAANSGSGMRALVKGASGGELSRLMLALEVVLADNTTVPTLVFDEVDAGIGGKAAVEVGRRLARLAEHAQVIAVTHLPQVAAFADHHFVVTKDDDGNVTSSSVNRVDDSLRVDELARMLAGQEDSATAQAHARELLELARG